METAFYLAYIAFGGMAFTSFGMVLGYRWHSGRTTSSYLLSIAKEPSKCDHCKKKLSLLECSPIIGWAWQRGKHSCGQKIPFTYPLSELIGGIFAWYIGYTYGVAAGFAILPLIAGVAGAIVSDLKENEIHELMSILIGIGAATFSYFSGHLMESFWISIGVGILFLTISYLFVMSGKMPLIPMGDLTLITGLSLALTIDSALTFFIALAVVSLIGKKYFEKYSKQGEELEGAFPLGPALCIAACIAII